MSRVFTFWGLKNKIPIFCAHLIELVELIPTIYMRVSESAHKCPKRAQNDQNLAFLPETHYFFFDNLTEGT